MKILDILFGAPVEASKDSAPLEPVIAPGQKWALSPNHDRDPWGSKDYPAVKILDVRSGWVRYDMGPRSPFRDERMEIKHFVRMYKRQS